LNGSIKNLMMLTNSILNDVRLKLKIEVRVVDLL